MLNIIEDFEDIKLAVERAKENNLTAEDLFSQCHDCGVDVGGRHILGCDMERCGICGGQMISCVHSETRFGRLRQVLNRRRC